MNRKAKLGNRQAGLGNRLLALRVLGVPAIFGRLDDMLMPSFEEHEPELPVAAEDVLALDHSAVSTAWITWTGRISVAEHLAEIWAERTARKDSDIKRARLYGELLGAPLVASKNTVEHRDLARSTVINTLKANPPTLTMLKQAISDIVKACNSAGDGLVPVEEWQDVMPPQTDGDVQIQTYEFYRFCGHLIPCNVFTNEASVTLWRNRSNNFAIRYDFAGFNTDLVNDIATIWLASTPDTVLGFFEGLARRHKNVYRNILAAAVFTNIVGLAKDANLTNAWVTRRMNQFKAAILSLDISDYTNANICKHYASLYPRHQMDKRTVYKLLVVYWNLLKGQSVTPLTGIIEQLAVSNVTGLTTMIEVFNKFTVVNTDYIIEFGIPKQQFQSTLKLMGYIYYDRFCTIVDPVITLQEYADLAALACILQRSYIKDVAFSDYRGQAERMANLGAATLNLLASDIWRQAEEHRRREKGIFDTLAIVMKDNETDIRVIGESAYMLPSTSIQACGPNTEDNQEKEISLKEARANWDRAAKALPAGTVRLTLADASKLLKEKLSTTSIKFKEACEIMKTVTLQTDLPEMEDTASRVHYPYTKVDEKLIACLQAWEVTCPPEWSEEPAHYRPDRGMPDANIFLLPRTTCNPLPAVPAPEDPVLPPGPPPPPASTSAT